MNNVIKKGLLSSFIIFASTVSIAHAELDVDIVLGDGRPRYRHYDEGFRVYVDPYARTHTRRYYAPRYNLVYRAQYRLAYLGYYSGPVDGIIGAGTRRAIRNFQADHGIRPSGNLNNVTLSRLGLI